MKKLLLSICLTLAVSASSLIFAQAPNHQFGGHGGHGGMSFEQFMSGRIGFLVAEMKLNSEDSAKFVKLYNEMMAEKGQLMRKYRGGRELYHKLFTGQNVPDSLYTNVVMNNAKLQLEDAQLEMNYLEKFSKILTPRQLFDYQSAERKFKSTLMQRPRK